MVRAVTLFLVMAFLISIFLGCAGPQPGVVAKVGKYTITADDLNKAIGNARFKSFEDELKGRKERVEKLAEDKLLLLAAYDEGLDKNPELQQRIERSRENLILNSLYKVEVESKAGEITEDEIKAVYERMKELIHAKHILVKSKELADSIYKLLENGADFDELAAKYSEDRSTKTKGGDIGDFTAMAMLKEFEDAAYSLSPGELSKPVKTQYGWHIIKVVERKPNPRLKPFEEQKAMIKRSLDRRKKSDMANKFIDKVFDEAKLKLNEDAVNVVLNVYKDAKPSDPKENFQPALTPEQRAMTLFTYSDGSWTIAQFDSAFQAIPPFRRQSLTTESDVENFIKMALRKQLLLKKAEKINIQNTDQYKKLYEDELERRMVDEFRKKYLYKDIEPTDEQIKAFYDANPDSFMQGEQVRVIEIQVSTEDEAKKLLDKIKNGEDMGKLATEHTLRTYVKAKGGDLGFFTERRYPDLFRAAKTLKVGEVYPKPIPFQNKYSIIKLVETKEAQRRPFDSVKRMIKNKLRTKMRKEAYNKWVEQAKQKYGFHIYESEIEKTIDKSKYEKKSPPA